MNKKMPVAKLKSKNLVNSDADFIINHVTNGGSLTLLAKTLGCDFSEIMNMIRKDEDLHERYKQAIEDRKEWARESIIEELNYMSAYDIKDMVRPDGTLKTVSEMPEELSKSIKEIDSDGSVKFESKLKALAQKHEVMGLKTQNVEVSGSLSLTDIILGAKRLESGDA